MRVVIDAVGIGGHGGAAVLLELFHWLPRVRKGWTWHWIILDRTCREFPDPVIDASGVTVEQTRHGGSGASRLMWLSRSLPERVRKLRADVVLSFANIGMPRPPVPNVVFLHQANIFPSSSGERQTGMKTVRYRVLRYLILRGLRKASGVIVQTESMKRDLRLLAPWYTRPAHVIPSGCRTDEGTELSEKTRALLESLGTAPIVSYVSLPRPHKNHARLLEAWQLVARRVPAARLLLTVDKKGASNEAFARIAEQLAARAAGLGIEPSVVWAGELPPADIPHLLRRSSLLVFPSLVESFGLPLAEALCADCPIAAADLPYAHDVAEGAALYFDPLSAESICAAIVTLMKDREVREKISRAGVEVRERYQYESIAGMIAAALEGAA